MFLGHPHLEMAGCGVFIASPTIIVVGQKQQLSVDGRIGQSGAHRIRTVHCPVPCHVSRSLRSVAIDHWIRPLSRLSDAHRTVWCYNLRAPVVVHSTQTAWCTPDMLLFTVWCATSALDDCPLHGFLRNFLGLLFVLESWSSKLLLCLLLRCCIINALVQSSLHPVNYKYIHWQTH
jgi:hypothetical protein